ncbi:MAG: hypothetical protein H6622_08515 [Halobacteriovoraceae bacterium]|nr:hypothetical protein [Halobacteriovoraceae bacterium]
MKYKVLTQLFSFILLFYSFTSTANDTKRAVLGNISACEQVFTKEVILVVEPFSSGIRYPNALRKMGYDVIPVLNSEDVLPLFKKSILDNLDAFQDFYILNGNFNGLLQKIGDRKVAGVIWASESSVISGNSIARRLGLPSNSEKTMEILRNKYKFGQKLRESGLSSVEEIATNDVEEAIAFFKERGIKGPIIMKDLQGAASFGFNKAEDFDHLRQIFAENVGRKDIFGNENSQFLFQEFLDGTEYVINGTTRTDEKGVRRTIFSSHWRYTKTKIGTSLVYRRDALEDFDLEIYRDVLRPHVLDALDAVGYNNGPFHFEVMVSNDGVPKIIDPNARIMGADKPKMSQPVFENNMSELEWDILRVTFPQEFDEIADKFNGYKLKEHLYFVTFNVFRDNEHFSEEAFNKVKSLPSFREVSKLHYKDGQLSKKSSDLTNVAAEFTLINKDIDQLNRDYERALEIEQEIFVSNKTNIKKLIQKLKEKYFPSTEK